MQQRETLQIRVYKSLLMRIYEGELPCGSTLPTLQALCQQYNVSEKCARAVVARLKSEGFLSTKRGRPARILPQQNPLVAVQTAPAFVCDKKTLLSFYKAIHLLFPSIYTHACMNCTPAQRAALGKIVQRLPTGAAGMDNYVALNIHFFKTVLSCVRNKLVLHIVSTIMQNTVLPAALFQSQRERLETEFLQSAAAMRRVYAGVLANDAPYVKQQWQLLFEITENTAMKATMDGLDTPGKEHRALTALQPACSYKYLLIAQDIYEKIMDGTYPVGTFLPALADAQTRYHAARVTVQAAYRVLAELGILHTTHGRGSTVVRVTFGVQPAIDEGKDRTLKRDYGEAIAFLHIVCEDLILYAQTRTPPNLTARLTGALNPEHKYSALILCKYLMREAHSLALDTLYQSFCPRLYWGIYCEAAPGGITAAEKHALCMEIANALETQQPKQAVALTQKLLDALARNAA